MTTLYLRGPDLLLSDPVVSATGQVLSGWVENGCWVYRATDTTWFAYRDWGDDLLSPVTHRFRGRIDEVVLVPREKRGKWNEYAECIGWARTQPSVPAEELQAAVDALAIEYHNTRTTLSGFEDMDDNIPF